MRAELLKIRELEYIKAAEAMGFSRQRIIFRHALPNALGPVLITIAFGVAGAVLTESSLSFLGLGGGPNEITWGLLLKDARVNFSAWWLAVFPGLAIFVTVTIFNLLGEGLTEALDPKQK
jgi:peptide/nickel transport system permease protein